MVASSAGATFDSIPPQFTTMISEMKAGDVSQPVRGPSGYQLIQLAETRDAAQVKQVDEYRAQAILIDPVRVGGDEVARQKAEEMLSRIGKGEDMGKLAKEFSSPDLNAEGPGASLTGSPRTNGATQIGSANRAC